MHLLGQTTLGIAVLVLLGLLVLVKRLATGSIIKDRPKDDLQLWITHLFNLFFLLAVNPVAAILLITHRLPGLDPTHLAIESSALLAGLEGVGMGLYLMGFLLMAWGLLKLGRNYQAGGSAPRAMDGMVLAGPYRFVRHPMYTAALSIALGLACLFQSLAIFSVFGIYLALILTLIPLEEKELRRAYKDQYLAYQGKVKKLIPLFY